MDAGVVLFTTDVPDTLRLVGTLGLSSPDALYAFVVDFGQEQAYLGTKWYYGLGLLANGHMTLLASLTVFCGVGSWRACVLLRRSFWYSFLEVDRVTHFSVFPNSQQDEAMFIGALGHLGRSPSPEKHDRMVLVTSRT